MGCFALLVGGSLDVSHCSINTRLVAPGPFRARPGSRRDLNCVCWANRARSSSCVEARTGGELEVSVLAVRMLLGITSDCVRGPSGHAEEGWVDEAGAVASGSEPQRLGSGIRPASLVRFPHGCCSADEQWLGWDWVWAGGGCMRVYCDLLAYCAC